MAPDALRAFLDNRRLIRLATLGVRLDSFDKGAERWFIMTKGPAGGDVSCAPPTPTTDGRPASRLCPSANAGTAVGCADVVFLMGARFNWIFHFGQPPRYAKDVKVIQLDIAPEEIGHNKATEERWSVTARQSSGSSTRRSPAASGSIRRTRRGGRCLRRR